MNVIDGDSRTPRNERLAAYVIIESRIRGEWLAPDCAGAPGEFDAIELGPSPGEEGLSIGTCVGWSACFDAVVVEGSTLVDAVVVEGAAGAFIVEPGTALVPGVKLVSVLLAVNVPEPTIVL